MRDEARRACSLEQCVCRWRCDDFVPCSAGRLFATLVGRGNAPLPPEEGPP